MMELRRLERGDAGLIYDAWGQYRDNFTYLTASVFLTIADAQRYIDKLLANPAALAFHIVEAQTGRIVGLVKANIEVHRAQVGYVVHQPHWGKGHATTAVQRLTAMLESDPAIARIWATCALENAGSIRVLEKCGYVRECTLKSWVAYPALGGRVFDNYSYIKIKNS